MFKEVAISALPQGEDPLSKRHLKMLFISDLVVPLGYVLEYFFTMAVSSTNVSEVRSFSFNQKNIPIDAMLAKPS